jgi:hydrogenase/urease accessory protein HupE
VYVNKKHQTITTLRQIVPLLFVIYLSVGAILSILNPMVMYMYLIVLAFYFIAGLHSAFKQSNKLTEVINIVKTFFLLHYSYGLGYLKGIIDFYILNKSIKKEESLTR